MPANRFRPSNTAASHVAAAGEAAAGGVRRRASLNTLVVSILLGALSPALLSASFAESPSIKHAGARSPTAPAAYAYGEVKKIDPERGMVMLKHGPIEHMGMPDMTMTFHLVHPEQAERLKVGDQVHFRVEKIAGTLVVVDLSPGRSPIAQTGDR